MDQNLFEIASRQKLTFPFRGQIFTQDLWDLKPAQLNEVFQTLKSQYHDVSDSLIEVETDENSEISLKIEIVKHIFNVKKQEAADRENEAQRREKKRRLQELLARKQEQGLEAMSEQELQDMLNGM